MDQQINLLIVDDDLVIRTIISNFLSDKHLVYTVEKPSEALAILKTKQIDIMISDIRLPEMDGLELLKKVKSDFPDIEIIMISSHAEMDTVIEAMRLGAFDFFKKPFNTKDIQFSIERTVKYRELSSKLRRLQLSKSLITKELKERDGIEIISQSDAMDKVKEIIYKVAQTPDTSVLISGESGTGKELIARGIHYLSSRKDEYFGAVNTSAVPESLFESEFFGHKKGSFTGAVSDKAGWFEVADKGTLFLDEIGDMPANLQVKLLRVLEDRQFNKVGTSKQEQFDIRILAATNKDIAELSSGNDFRKDLYYRIATFEINVPPLRERKEDIPLLLEHFTQYFAARMKKTIHRIDHNAELFLQQYDFPGNVRELRNFCERAVILCDGQILKPEHFPDIKLTESITSENSSEFFDLGKIEKQTILRALEKTGNNKSKTAKLLNIEWNALHRRLKKYGIS